MIRRLQYQREKVRRYDDLFFHPLICHVCKRLNDGNTFLCGCGVISYCCEEHMTMDREQSDDNVGHGEICDVIKQLMDKKLMRGFSGGTIYEWDNCKNNYMRLIKNNLLRELTRHEKLMISYIRACLICYKETDLKPCKSCFCVDYCEAHCIKDDHPCDELKAWLYFEIQAISINSVPEWLTFHDFPDRGVVDDMQSFYKTGKEYG
ncbi:uncharacterized protein LOC116841750 [Odontomachus brunneus]|uniref:uncharacterized protein LOC116841750 n=1 Tax=Odontomachus brunneus TaxID=486640 RepID=UPI0013F1EF16|nr:uncharacterized protein LOC116841750 [Odontomachus brunneus]